MSQSQDEARAARILKYKEERRKQLTARTATLFSANVTDRRQRKPDQATAEGSSALKSSSELNLAASTALPIRTTRASRLRAAAANQPDTPRKPNRSSSVQSLLEDDKNKTTKLIERDKKTRRQSREKENLKSSSTSCFPERDGAKTKPKHSSNRNILDKTSFIVSSPKKIGDVKSSSLNEKHKAAITEVALPNGDIHMNGVLSTNHSDEVEDLLNNLKLDDKVIENQNSSLTNGKSYIPEKKEDIEIKKVDSVVMLKGCDVPSKVSSGLLEAVCVRKVKRFSELLSNLCSPYEADLLFEDILVENGIDGDIGARKEPECVAPCRRIQPSQKATSTPKRTPPSNDAGTATTKLRRPLEAPHPKTESSLPSYKVSPKNNLNLSFGLKSPQKPVSTSSTPQKPHERRRSSDSSKPSCIPLSRKTLQRQNRTSISPVKQDLTKGVIPNPDTIRNKVIKTPEKSKSDTENNKNDTRHRVQKDSKSLSEKYHNSKKRLTSLDKSSKKSRDVKKSSTENLTDANVRPKSDDIASNTENCKDTDNMSLVQEAVRPHASTSRLSQEMDNLAALTKQTLDRVNKLSSNLTSNKKPFDSIEPHYETLFTATSDPRTNGVFNFGSANGSPNRGVSERLKDIDAAAQRLIDFEKQSAMFSDLNNDPSSQNRRFDLSSSSCQTPVSILKRKSLMEDTSAPASSNNAIASPPVTFSPSVIEPRQCRSESRHRQGILKKRRSLDESQVVRRSCSPEVSFADDGSLDSAKPILKNRRSSLEDIIRNRSPDGIQGILKRKMSREEEQVDEIVSYDSPEPHSILKRKSNSSSSGSNTPSHVSITQAVLLAAAGGAEIIDDDKETVKPILKKKSFSEERPRLDILPSDTPKPILKKKSVEHEEHDFDLPKKPILKLSKRLSDDGHTSSFDQSEDDRSSRRPSLLRSRTSDHSGSECEAAVRPILKQRGSSLTRERSQSPRPRLSFCDNDANISAGKFSNDSTAAGPSRVHLNADDDFPSAVIRRRNQRPRTNPRSISLASDVNDELLSILNNRRLKVDENCANDYREKCDGAENSNQEKSFPSIAARIQSMELALTKDQPSTSRSKNRDKERYKTQPITVDEMRSITSSLEPSQQSFQAFDTAACSFPNRPAVSSTVTLGTLDFPKEEEGDPFSGFTKTLESPIYSPRAFKSPTLVNGVGSLNRNDSFGEATFLDFENIGGNTERRQSTLDEIEQEVNKVRLELEEESRALEEDEKLVEGDNWSLNVSCDSGVYNRASSRDSGPHSGEELGLIESQEIQTNHTSNSDWSPSSIEHHLLTMDRERKSTVNEARDDDDDDGECRGFNLGLVKSNSVIARASMWQQLQEQAKGIPKPLVRYNRSKTKDLPPVVDRFKTQPISFIATETPTVEADKESPLAQSKSTANVLDRDEDAKLDEDDPAKLSLSDKMKMFNLKLMHKPPSAAKGKEERSRAPRLRTMPVLASQVQEAMENNERLTKSLTHEDVPRNPDFQLKMELFRSASAKNTSLEYLMRQNAKFRSLDCDDSYQPAPKRPPLERAQTKPEVLTKGDSSEGLKDEGIDSSSDEESTSSATSSEKSCSSSESSVEIPAGPKPRRFQRKNNKIKSSRTESDLTRLQDKFPVKIQLPGADELKARFQKNEPVQLAKLARRPSQDRSDDDSLSKRTKNEPIQLAKLRRPCDKPPQMPVEEKPPVLKISASNLAAKNKFFGVESALKPQERSIEELTAVVRKYIPPVSKSSSTQLVELAGSGSDGESSGGREVRRINSRARHRFGGGVQRSATHAEMPNRGGTIAERLAALQAAGANDWRARVCRISPDKEDSKAIERAKNAINDNLTAAVDDKKKIQLDENELGPNILADRRTKLETAAQGWRKRVPQTDASSFTVAGRLERDKVSTVPPAPPSPVAAIAVSPAVPVPNKFRSRKPTSPTHNGFASAPLRSASCAVVSAPPVPPAPLTPLTPGDKGTRVEREGFKRSHSVSESISQHDHEDSIGLERTGFPVRVPRADDETFHAFFQPLQRVSDDLNLNLNNNNLPADLDLDAIDSASRQMLTSECSRRAKRERRHVASRNPLKALAQRTDLRQEYLAQPLTITELRVKERATANCGLAAEALAALASKEDFTVVSLRSAAAAPSAAAQPLLLQVKGRRRVQTRLVEPVHTSVNRGDCFLLVTHDQLLLYIGLYANVIERNRSTDIALHIQNTKDLNCKCTSLIKIDEQNKNYQQKHWNTFWTLLGVTENVENYKPAETGNPDEDELYESCILQTNMCYEVVDDELVPIKQYWGQMPKIEMLNQAKIIVFDFGSEMYIWYGKNVLLESRRKAAQLAQELFDDGYNYEECHLNPLTAASSQGKRDTLQSVEKSAKTRPEWATLTKVTQHMESILFKEKFADWPDYSRVIKVKAPENKSNSTDITPCDAEEMWANEYQEPDLVLEGSHIGRGTSYFDKEAMRHYEIKTKSLSKWVIREYDFQKVENETEIGEFFSADSYIIRWEYQITVTGRELNGKPSKHNITGRDRCAYFCWQGRDASSNEKGAAALLTVELDRERGPQIRVAQGNEPAAFLNLFQGSLVINQGKRSVESNRYRLYVTRGNVANEAYLLQVPCSVRQLRSRGSLLLVDTERPAVYIWHGNRSMKHTKAVAIELANRLVSRKSSFLFGDKADSVEITEVKENEESEVVLKALGVANRQHYGSVLQGVGGSEGSDGQTTPRLFHFTDLGGQFEAHEVLSPLRNERLVTPFPFEQRELYAASQPALFLLDAGDVWVWQGWWPRATDGELEPKEINSGVGAFASRWQALRVAALRTAERYCRVRAAAGANGDKGANGGDNEHSGEGSGDESGADCHLVMAGLEPDAFIALFDTWTECDEAADVNIAHGHKAGARESARRELGALCAAAVRLPLCALQQRPPPPHADPRRLEAHLTAADFQEAFGMTKEEFSVLPSWKQTSMKKDLGLF